jgi:hypothetical protein
MGDAGYAGAPSAQGMSGGQGVPGAQGGAPMAGVQGGAPMGGAQGGASAAGDKFSQWAAQYGIPRDALVNDYLTNGGKGIAEMIAKRGTPDMQVSNGYAYDKNRLGAGYLPQLNMSQDGKASMVQIGPDGMPVVSAPRGAVDTFNAYQGAAAGWKPARAYDSNQQREVWTNEAALAQGGGARSPGPMAGAPGNVQSVGYSGGDRNSANAESIRMIESELTKPGNSPADIAGMKREIQRLQMQSGGAPTSGNYAAGPSAQETATNDANRTKAVNTAAADVVRDTATQKKEKSAGEMIAAVRRARDLLKEGPTASGAGEIMDKTAAFFGKSTKGAEVSSKLDIVAGDLLNNVPRMEGPQSDGDRVEYKIQAGRAADRSVPTPQRLAAMDELERLQSKYAKLNGGATPSGGASGDWSASPSAPKLKAPPSAADLQNTALKYGMTVDQVKQKLGL